MLFMGMHDNTQENISELIQRMRATGKKKFVLQLPEGLKTRATDIISALEKEGFEIIWAADPSYGACDLALEEARVSEAEALVHVGHSKFYVDFETPVPVLYFPWKMNADFDNIDISIIKEKNLGIITTIQHTDILNEAKKFFETKGKTAIIGGQILGCWTLSAEKIEDKVDAFVFIGSGHFHPLAIKDRKKPVYVVDIEKRTAEKLNTELFEKRRWANIYKARDAKTFAILVSAKAGQKELLGVAADIKRKIESAQKQAIILIMDEITEAKLQGIRAGAFVNTACPRILDDTWTRPIINAMDIDLVLGE